MTTKKNNKDTLRYRNLQLVLQQVFNNPRTSRIEISRHLDLNKSTISSLFNELNEKHYFIEEGEGKTTTVGGRKPQLISFNKHYGYIINFDIGFNHLQIMTNYITGEPIRYQDIDTPNWSIHSLLNLIIEQTESEQALPKTLHGLLGIGISFHGVVYKNMILDSPFLEMEDIDLASILSDRFNVPIVIENEANLSAIFIRDFLHHDHQKNLLSVSVHKGIGAGIIHSNQLHLGLEGHAGEIGRSLLYSKYPGTEDFITKVEELCSEDALVEQLRLIKHEPTLSRKNCIALLQSNHPEVQELTTHFIYNLTCVIYNSIASYAPDVVYLNSPMLEKTPHIQGRIKADLYQLAPECPLFFLKEKQHASLFGSCSLVTHEVLGLRTYDLRFHLDN